MALIMINAVRMRNNRWKLIINSLIFFCRGFTYYKMSNLDSRIANPDQLLTTDVDKFCESCTNLYSNITKPLLDIAIYVYRLTTNLGGEVCEIKVL